MIVLAVICLAFGAIPNLLLLLNLALYRKAPTASPQPPSVSVLIPARNEEQNIGRCVESVLANVGAHLEVLVLDDQSSDRTAAIVQEFASRDHRLRLLSSLPLPTNWCGKQFACHQLSQHATAPYLCFIDADVTLAPDALGRAVAYLDQSRVDLVSGIPRQLTGTFAERLFVPLIHFILLAYLPLGFMRRFRHRAFAAGCGQFFLARRESYERIGGHRSIAQSGHDGIHLPRAFRSAGFRTDLFDLTDIACCRMYSNAAAVWTGLTKNATEGIAHPARIVPFTVLFLFGQVLPPCLLVVSLLGGLPPAFTIISGVGTALSYAARFASAWRFRQSWLGAALHPVALAAFLVTQWWALVQEKRGRPVFWKGRKQPRAAI
jgi:hypothetical protein